MADRTYVSNSPTTVTTRELLTVAVSFANRLGDGETVTLTSTTAGVEVKLEDKATGADASVALSGIAATSPNVGVTIDFANAALAKSKTYVLRIRGTISAGHKPEALWDFITSWI
jgi:hypothetical protein